MEKEETGHLKYSSGVGKWRLDNPESKGPIKGSTTSREASMYDFSLSTCTCRLLRLRMKKNRARKGEMRTSPPITPPMIAPIGFLSMVELDGPSYPMERCR